MRGYDIYSFCRKIRGWNIPDLEIYLESKEKPFFELLCNYLFRIRQLNFQESKDFIKSNYNVDNLNFDPFKLLEEDAWKEYQNWKCTASTKGLYFEEIRKGFCFIETFCINNKLNLEQYKKRFAQKHIREKKIDYAIVVYLKLINIKELKKVEKILLQNYVSQYNIVKTRLFNPELNELLYDLTDGMNKILNEYKNNKSINK